MAKCYWDAEVLVLDKFHAHAVGKGGNGAPLRHLYIGRCKFFLNVGEISHQERDMIGGGLTRNAGALRRVEQDHNPRQLDDVQCPGMGNLGAKQVDPEFFVRLGIGHEPMHVANRDAALIFGCQLCESRCGRKDEQNIKINNALFCNASE